MKITREHWQNILSTSKDILDYEREHPIGSERCRQCDVMITQREHLVIPKELWYLRICVDCFFEISKDILDEEEK
jgi:hypothetical protein